MSQVSGFFAPVVMERLRRIIVGSQLHTEEEKNAQLKTSVSLNEALENCDISDKLEVYLNRL